MFYTFQNKKIKGFSKGGVLLFSVLLLILYFSNSYAFSKTSTTVISNQTTEEDFSPPFIVIANVFDGEIVTESNLTVEFIVFDDVSVKEIFVNSAEIPVSEDGNYSHDLILTHGKNLISITAIDSSNNSSTAELVVEFLLPEELENEEDFEEDFPEDFEDVFGDFEDIFEGFQEFIDLTIQLIEELTEKIVISILEEFDDLNQAITDQFLSFTEGLGEAIDIAQAVSVEIANAPIIPEGFDATFELPEFKSIDFFKDLEEIFEIPKGFSFATDISFKDFSEPITISEEDLSNQNAAVLVDADGKTFVVGFAFFKKAKEGLNSFRQKINRNYKYQTESGKPLELTTTITIPADAKVGDANISILNKNESLASIPLRVAPPREVKVKNKQIGKPEIIKPITAIVKKSGKELILKIKGKNFIRKIATIDGDLQRLVGKATFTNVTFVPFDGIQIKSIRVRNRSITLKAKIKNNIEPGIKLFNVITPKGADIGAIVFPENLSSGKLETSVTPEDLILTTN